VRTYAPNVIHHEHAQDVAKWLNITIKSSLAALLAVALLAPDQPQFEGKAMPLRAVFFPLAAAAVPVVWLLAGRKRPYPHAADALLVAGLLLDTAGNVGDAYSWDPFDDIVHGTDSALRTAGLALLFGRLRVAPWNVVALAAGATLVAHTGWEVVEFALDRWLAANLNVGYADTIGDSALALAGASLAAIAALQLTTRPGRG
jgi:hypothetical protein